MSDNLKFLRFVSEDGKIHYINPNDISHVTFGNSNSEIKLITSILLRNGDKINIDIDEKEFIKRLGDLAGTHSIAVGKQEPNHMEFVDNTTRTGPNHMEFV